MAKRERIVRHTEAELVSMRQGGESRSDWAKAAAMTHDEIEASVASDPSLPRAGDRPHGDIPCVMNPDHQQNQDGQRERLASQVDA